jgi:MoaA/NifB/PqqE/SkfB family radical SAM enzyme
VDVLKVFARFERKGGPAMKKSDVLKAWGRILTGDRPSLSIEITRECPLRCPGCYAYEPEHLQEIGQGLRSVSDFKGDELIDRVLDLVKVHRPLHLSIVGGEPLVRFRELTLLLPQLSKMGIAVQLVTSAVREIPKSWATIENLHLVVSIDGLQPEHDARRKPATYERILRNIKDQKITVHCTITGQTANRPGYYREFLEFWSAREEVKKIWFSLFTPQIGAVGEEILTPAVRAAAIAEIERLKPLFPKLNMPRLVIEGLRRPPASPNDCIFAQTTLNYTADLKSKVAPCQFGGAPDCAQCGCIASAGLAAVGNYKLFGAVPLKKIFVASDRIGKKIKKLSA